MWNRLTRTVEPEGDVLDLAAVKLHLRVEAEDTDQDANIQRLMAAAVRRVDGPKALGVALLTQTWRLSLDHWEDVIEIPIRPAQSIVSITYLDPTGAQQTLDPSLYGSDFDKTPARVFPALNCWWPPTANLPGAIKITFVAGYGDPTDIPEDLGEGMMMLISHWYQNRDAVVGVENRDSSTPLPMGVAMTFDDYRADWIS